jgi:transcriptional regulator with XRE-family HTH domain
MDAGNLLAVVRRRRGLTQAELAARAGTTQPVISAYEHGRRDPSTATLHRLIAASGERLVLDARPVASEGVTGSDLAAHGVRLTDLLALVDALPRRPAQTLMKAPRLCSR